VHQEQVELLGTQCRKGLVERALHVVRPVDLEVTEMYGAVTQMVRSVGRNPAPRAMDLLIAATAARHRLPLLTSNAGDLEGVEAAVTVVPVD
jgi:predicted nucleic acid-binding protein